MNWIKRLFNKKAETKQCDIHVVMWRLIGWLYPKCNHCNKGRLLKIDTYHYKTEMDIDIYRCNKCKNRVCVNAT